MISIQRLIAALALTGAVATSAVAAPLTYNVDGSHTFPRFSYLHFGYSTQLSSFSKTTGKVVYDAQAQQGSVDIVISTNVNPNNEAGQQQRSVNGKVTDSTGGSLPGVSVVVKGTAIGVITDMDGKFSISKVPENAILVFSFVGMKAQEISVGNKTTINAVLTEESIGIEEVVAVGYGTAKKRDIIGSVASVNMEELKVLSVIMKKDP